MRCLLFACVLLASFAARAQELTVFAAASLTDVACCSCSAANALIDFRRSMPVMRAVPPAVSASRTIRATS